MNLTLPCVVIAALSSLPFGGDGDGPATLPVAQGKEIRVVPVRQLVMGFATDPLPPLGLALALDELASEPGSWEAGHPSARVLFRLPTDSTIQLDRLMEELRTLDPSQWEREGVSLAGYFDRVYVVHERAVADRVDAHVRRLRDTLAPRFAIRWACFEDPSGGSAFRRLAFDDAGRLLAEATSGGRVLQSGTAHGRPGDRMTLGRQDRITIQGDVNVEVAHTAKVGDPVIQSLELGTSVSVLPVLRPDGKGVAIFGLFSHRALGPDGIQGQDLVASRIRTLESADVDEAQSLFSVGFDGDGAVLLAPGGAAHPALRVLLMIERLTPVPEAAAAPAIVPTGLLTCRALTRFTLAADQQAEEKEARHVGVDLSDRMQIDWVVDTMRHLSGEADEKIAIDASGWFVTLRGPEASVAQMQRTAQFLMRDLDRSFLVEIGQEIAPAEGGPWQPLGPAIQIPCLGDRVGFALQGNERSYIADYDVEIAQKSSIADPVVRSIFAGSQVIAGVSPDGDACRVALEVLDRGSFDLRRVAASVEEAGTIWCPRQSETWLSRVAMLKPGESQPLGEGAQRRIDGRLHRTRLTVKLTEL